MRASRGVASGACGHAAAERPAQSAMATMTLAISACTGAAI
ncbi:hypothetical protein [Nevskia sp.]|nr:hypothetical protein [Nevskia sp.]